MRLNENLMGVLESIQNCIRTEEMSDFALSVAYAGAINADSIGCIKDVNCTGGCDNCYDILMHINPKDFSVKCG